MSASWLGLAALAVAVFGGVMLLQAAVRPVIFPAPRGPAQPRIAGIPGLEIVQLHALGKDRAVEAWWMPPFDPSSGRATAPRAARALSGAGAPALLFFHGNGERIDDWVWDFQVPRGWGVGVMLVEYPGYGRSGGSASQRSVTATALEAYDRVVSRAGVDPSRIAVYGRSLGGGAACALAARRRVAALVLESTFTSTRALAARLRVPGFLIRDAFDNARVIAGFEGPVLLLHGEHDDLIPASESKRLHEMAAHSELVLLPCGHNDCPRSWPIVQRFLSARGLAAAPSSH